MSTTTNVRQSGKLLDGRVFSNLHVDEILTANRLSAAEIVAGVVEANALMVDTVVVRDFEADNVTVSNDLTVHGATAVGSLAVTSDVGVGQDMSVVGAITAKNANLQGLTVTQNSTFEKMQVMDGFQALGEGDFEGDLTVKGTTSAPTIETTQITRVGNDKIALGQYVPLDSLGLNYLSLRANASGVNLNGRNFDTQTIMRYNDVILWKTAAEAWIPGILPGTRVTLNYDQSAPPSPLLFTDLDVLVTGGIGDIACWSPMGQSMRVPFVLPFKPDGHTTNFEMWEDETLTLSNAFAYVSLTIAFIETP